MKSLNGKTAAVTGAASGIGRALAICLAQEGCAAAIADVDQEGLEETRRLVEAMGGEAASYVVDVADREAVYRFAEEVKEWRGGVDIIINNAGVAVTDTLEDVSYENFEWLMGVNFWGVVYGSKAFLPYLKRRPEGQIVNISSINGLVTNPNNGPYCSAKFAVRAFSETLRQELEGTSVGVSCIHPGGVTTDIVRNARFVKGSKRSEDRDDMVEKFEKFTMTSPEKAARIIIDGIKKDRKRVLVGPDAYVIDSLQRFAPRSMSRLVAFLFG